MSTSDPVGVDFMWRFLLLMLWPIFGFAMFYHYEDDEYFVGHNVHDEKNIETSEDAEPWEKNNYKNYYRIMVWSACRLEFFLQP